MKINKKYLVLRIISSPFKLAFTILWFNLIGFIVFVKWLNNGGQELYYNSSFGGNLTKLIESNEALIKSLEKQSKNITPLNNSELQSLKDKAKISCEKVEIKPLKNIK